jgi:hypothetical protein
VGAVSATCVLCGSVLVNGTDGWPIKNESGCINQYHDGGYGSHPAPGYCGVYGQLWYRRPTDR